MCMTLHDFIIWSYINFLGSSTFEVLTRQDTPLMHEAPTWRALLRGQSYPSSLLLTRMWATRLSVNLITEVTSSGVISLTSSIISAW